MICLSGKPVPSIENDQIGQNWVKNSGFPALNTGKVIWINSLKVRWEFVFSVVDFSCRCYCCCSVTQLCLTLCGPNGLQQDRLPSPSPSPGACSNSCPSRRWCQPTISSSIIPFSSLCQSFPASGSFSMSQFFVSGGQSIGVSASASFLPMNIQDWAPLGLTGWISFQSKGLSKVFSNTAVQKHNSMVISLLYGSTLTYIHDCWKNHTFDYMDLCWQSDVCAF